MPPAADTALEPTSPDENGVSAAGPPAVNLQLMRELLLGKLSAERHAHLLAELTQKLALLTQEAEIAALTTRLVGAHLQVQRCGFFEADEDRGEIVVAEGWRPEGVPSIAGAYRVGALIRPEAWHAIASGPVAIADVEAHPLTNDFAAMYRALGVRAFAACPCRQAKPRVFVLGVSSDRRWSWTEDELTFLAEVTARVWPLVERARADAALRESERRYRELVQALPAAVYTCDAEGRITLFNEPAVELWGRRPEPQVEKWNGAHRVYDADGTPLPNDQLPMARAILQGVEPRNEEIIIERPDGTRRLVLANPHLIHDHAGNIVGGVNMLIDITETKRAKEVEGRLAAIVESSTDAIIGTDLDGVITSWNTGATALFGYAVGEALGRPVTMLVPPERHDEEPEILARVRNGEHVASYETVRRRKDGRVLDISLTVSPIKNAEGRIVGASKIGRDITARKQADTALRESEARFHMATRAGKVGLWDWDIASDRVAWTESLYEIHGVKPHAFEPTLAAFLALVHPDDRAPVHRAIQSSVQHDARFELEFRALRPGGAVLWLFANAVVMREGGKATRMIGATLDITARKCAEIALRESEGRFRALASHAPVGIFLTDATGDCLFVNESWCAMTGLTPEQARGKGWTKALYPEDRERVAAEWYAAVKERRSFALEYRFCRPSGIITWVQGGAVEFRNASGGIGHIGTVADITERVAAADALRESEKRFRTLASHAPVGIFQTDPHGQTIFVNESWCRMTGLTVEDARGDGWFRAIHPEDRERVAAQWREAVQQGIPSTAEYRFRHVDGTIRWVHGHAVQLVEESNGVAGYIGTIADVTQRRIADERLRAQEAQLRIITNNAPVNLAHCSRDGRFLFVNRANADRLHLEPEQIVGRSLEEVLGREAVAAIQPYIDRVLAGETFTDELEMPYKTIGRRFVRVSYTPAVADDGMVGGWLCAMTDITERRQMEIELRAAQAQLQRHATELEQRVAERTASLRDAIVQMEEFSYSVSHDLRAPLRAMNAYAQALAEDYGPRLDATARDYLERIQRSSRRMEKLTHDVLTYSRISRAEVQLAEVDLNLVLRDLLAQYAELQPTAADLDIEPDLPNVRGHESSIGQCLANLLTNAAKFVAPGVRPRIRVRSERFDGRVRLWIEDNGIGINPDYLPNLFRMFERVPTRHHYSGTGIGLALVRKAMEKMGGQCGAESDGQTGSRFWLEFPSA